jgi:hypothetical protein
MTTVFFEKRTMNLHYFEKVDHGFFHLGKAKTILKTPATLTFMKKIDFV